MKKAITIDVTQSTCQDCKGKGRWETDEMAGEFGEYRLLVRHVCLKCHGIGIRNVLKYIQTIEIGTQR